MILTVKLQERPEDIKDGEVAWDVGIDEYSVCSVIRIASNESLTQRLLNEIRELILFKQEIVSFLDQMDKKP